MVEAKAKSMKALTTRYSQEEIVLTACAAGADILLYPEDLEKSYNTVLSAVYTGTISEKQLDENLARIAKMRAQQC